VQDKEQGKYASPGWLKLTYGAASGAVVAAILGYGLSAWLSMLGFALILPTENIKTSLEQYLSRSGLNFLAIHHIRIIGNSMPGGSGGNHISIIWPITTWAIIPAVALMIGGFISVRMSNARGIARFISGALVAIPYVILLLVARPFFAVSGADISLPSIAIQGCDTILDANAQFSPSILSTIFHGLLFGVLFAGIGAFGGPIAAWRKLFQEDSFWPAWMRGAFIALIIGYVFFLFCASFAATRFARYRVSGDSESTLPLKTSITLIPAVSGMADYLAHGITLSGGTSSTLDFGQGFEFRAGLIRGIKDSSEKSTVGELENGGKKKPTPIWPKWAYLLLIIPALSLIIGGYITAKTAKRPIRKPAIIIGIAGMYALLSTVLIGFFRLTQSSTMAVGDMTNRVAITIGPSAAETFLCSLLFGFIFGLIGVVIYRQHDRP
jgi:hypothetical protein